MYCGLPTHPNPFKVNLPFNDIFVANIGSVDVFLNVKTVSFITPSEIFQVYNGFVIVVILDELAIFYFIKIFFFSLF